MTKYNTKIVYVSSWIMCINNGSVIVGQWGYVIRDFRNFLFCYINGGQNEILWRKMVCEQKNRILIIKICFIEFTTQKKLSNSNNLK